MAMSKVVKQLMFRSAIVFLIKIIGAFVRIPLFRWLGAEGVGLYQLVYAVYGLILTLVTGGLPTTLTLSTAKDRKHGLRMLQASLFFLAVIGGTIGLVVHTFAFDLAMLLGDIRLEWALRLIAPAVFIVPLLSLLRGFLQGVEFYGMIAVSELFEQVFRVLSMMVFVSLWIRYGIGLAVGGAALGAVVGAIVAMLFLMVVLIIYLRKMGTNEKIQQFDLGKLSFLAFVLFIRTSLAITAARFIMPLSDFIDAVIIPHRLQHAGLTNEMSTAIYGIFSGMAASIVYMPTLVSSSVSHIFSAKIASDWKNKQIERFQHRAKIILQRGWLWGLGCSVYFFYYHAPLSQFLFGNLSASKAILYMCAAPLISGMRELSTTILWAEDRSKAPMAGLLIGIIVSSVLGYVLVGMSGFSYEGVAIELLSLELVAAVWNIRVLQREHGQLFSLSRFFVEALLLLTISVVIFSSGETFVNLLNFSPQLRELSEMLLSFIGIFSYVWLRGMGASHRGRI